MDVILCKEQNESPQIKKVEILVFLAEVVKKLSFLKEKRIEYRIFSGITSSQQAILSSKIGFIIEVIYVTSSLVIEKLIIILFPLI